ncbi:hypothetical protein D0Y65_022132 [Glycine soja]|uniref:Uncharacterized protein n=1 Tax=Glycine soja TaxID=3848 RepID=A0A445JM80_GLYSO|nr:hypothetical protein D0Y65_022132 [Glycine soja]
MSLPKLPPSLEELGLDDSITIPHLPTSDLCGFVYCIILSVGSALIGNIWCSTYEDGIEVSWDRSNIIFIFGWNGDEERIKECGVFPVYATTSGLKLVSNSGKEIFECESIEWEQLLHASKRRKTSCQKNDNLLVIT